MRYKYRITYIMYNIRGTVVHVYKGHYIYQVLHIYEITIWISALFLHMSYYI